MAHDLRDLKYIRLLTNVIPKSALFCHMRNMSRRRYIIPQHIDTSTEIAVDMSEEPEQRVMGLLFSPNVQQVTLKGCTSGDVDLSPLSMLRNCHELTVWDCDDTDYMVAEACKYMPWLKIIVIFPPDDETSSPDLTPLARLHELQELHIAMVEKLDLCLSPLHGLRHLQWVSIKSASSGSRITTGDRPFMTEERVFLQLKICPMSEVDLSMLRGKFKGVILHNIQLPDIDLSLFRGAESVKILENTMKRVDLSELVSPVLRNLDLYKNELEHIDLSPLMSCPDLHRLYLAYNRIADIDLTPLGSCTNLQWLSLAYNRIDSMDLSPLSSCRKLEYLNLSNNRLTGLEMEPLTKTSLTELSLIDNRIEELDVTPLLHIPTLKKFHVWPNHRYGDTPVLIADKSLRGSINAPAFKGIIRKYSLIRWY